MATKIGIIGAMEIEIKHLLSKMEDKQEQVHATRTFYTGKLFGKDIVLVQSGIGKVNAGIVTQTMINLFDVDYIINTGIAGSLDASLDIGDIVVSDNVYYHDVDVREFGYAIGQLPGMKNANFVASETLLNLTPARDHIKKGTIATGDQFINNSEIKKEIKANFSAMCVEMEGAAIAHTCFLNDKGFLIVRSISDKADEGAKTTYRLNEELAVERATEITEEILKGLS